MADDVAQAERIAHFFDVDATALDAQYRAAMDGVVLIDRSHLARVAVTGSDRIAFLHNMLSCDVKNLPAGAGAEGTFLTNKGKLVASFSLSHDGERVLLEMESERVSPLMDALSKFIISEDVALEDLRAVEASFSVEGPGASGIVARLSDIDASELDGLDHLALGSTVDVRVTARRRDPSPRFDVAAPPARALELMERARELGAVVASSTLAEVRRIEAGRPRFGIDMDESHLPLEAGLDDAISFDKGCYIGQEYVVRLAHRGHLNRKLVGLAIEGDEVPAAGTDVYAREERTGELTSAGYSPHFGAIVALGYVRRDCFEAGTKVTVDGRPGEVASLPFAH